MTFVPGNDDNLSPVCIRASEAERINLPTSSLTLLADSTAAGGALSVVSSELSLGGDGAIPHHHLHSSETFYILSGSVDVLAGSDVLTVSSGDLVIVPPGMTHAFGATAGHDAEILILITPGVERFDYFRLLERVTQGRESRDALLAVQEQYDTYFADSQVWRSFRVPHQSSP